MNEPRPEGMDYKTYKGRLRLKEKLLRMYLRHGVLIWSGGKENQGTYNKVLHGPIGQQRFKPTGEQRRRKRNE